MSKKKKKTECAGQSRQYVIVRCTAAGVHAGVLVSRSGQDVVLEESRRLWQWRVPMGAPSFLSGVATHGLDCANSKVGTPITVTLTEASEVIVCSAVAEKSIRSAPEVLRVS